MPKRYSSEQFWKLYGELPQELKNALFAQETGENIYRTCEKNGALERLGDIVDSVGAVLVGLLPTEDFQEELEKEIGLEKDLAKKMAQEINRFIFYPVKPALDGLYSMGVAPAAKPTKMTPPTEEKPTTSAKEDTYREPIE